MIRFRAYSWIACMLLVIPAGLFHGCSNQGCTDSRARNFDPGAKYDDGSCTYCGCGDTLALNHKSNRACYTNDSCDYRSDYLVGSYTGRAVIQSEAGGDTLDDYHIEVGQEMYDPNVLWVIEDGTLRSMKPNCGSAEALHTDTNYIVHFERTATSEQQACFTDFPTRFEFRFTGDTLSYSGHFLVNAAGDERGINFEGTMNAP